MKFIQIKIDSCETLESAADYYHDAKLYIDRIAFDEVTQFCRLKLHRIKWEETAIHCNLFFIQVCSAPRIESVLYFKQIRDVKMHLNKDQLSAKGEPIDFINIIRYYPRTHRIEINCVNGSHIELFVEQLDGMIKDTVKSEGRSYFIYLFGIEIGGQ